jgi:D-alanine-D-alanine ligase
VPKLRVGVIFGGRSTEHEVSVVSATTVVKGLDPSRYEPVLIGIDHDGTWHAAGPDAELLPEGIFCSNAAARVVPAAASGLELLRESDGQPFGPPPDVVFPIVHGRGGEDGSLQGLLELAGAPYVGAGVLASAVAMDKALSKRVLGHAGIPVVPGVETSRSEALEAADPLLDRLEREPGLPAFVKPANTGSSVGVHRASDRASLREALRDAARYDLRVVVEPALEVREIECAVLGGHAPEASIPGEVVPSRDFYDYAAKYLSEDSQLLIPAPLDDPVAEEIRTLACRAFRAIDGWGMARVDFFLEHRTDRIYLNELNTLPGFTEISMYPMLWDATGVALPALLDRLIELALERHRDREALEIRYKT